MCIQHTEDSQFGPSAVTECLRKKKKRIGTGSPCGFDRLLVTKILEWNFLLFSFFFTTVGPAWLYSPFLRLLCSRLLCISVIALCVCVCVRACARACVRVSKQAHICVLGREWKYPVFGCMWPFVGLVD